MITLSVWQTTLIRTLSEQHRGDDRICASIPKIVLLIASIAFRQLYDGGPPSRIKSAYEHVARLSRQALTFIASPTLEESDVSIQCIDGVTRYDSAVIELMNALEPGGLTVKPCSAAMLDGRDNLAQLHPSVVAVLNSYYIHIIQ